MDGRRRHSDRLLDGIDALTKPADSGYLLGLQYRRSRVAGADCNQAAHAQRPHPIWPLPDPGYVSRPILGRTTGGLVHEFLGIDLIKNS